MIQLKSDSYQHLTNVLPNVPFNTWFVRSVLEGHVEGKVFVDKEIEPNSMYVCHKYGMTFLWGDSNNDDFNSGLMNYFDSIKQDEWLQAYPRDWDALLGNMVKSGKLEVFSRLNFNFNQKIFEENNAQFDLNSFDIQEGTVDMMKNINGRVVPKNFWEESKLDLCKSYVAMVDNKPASIAYTSYLHDNILEMGIETAEEHRGKGLALAVCIALIHYCIKKNLTPVWSCRLENTGSVKLAKRLGFVETARFPYYRIISK